MSLLLWSCLLEGSNAQKPTKWTVIFHTNLIKKSSHWCITLIFVLTFVLKLPVTLMTFGTSHNHYNSVQILLFYHNLPPCWPSSKVSTSKPADLGSIPTFPAGFFPTLSHISALKIGTLVAILPGAWFSRVSAETGWPSLSTLWLCKIASLVRNFYLSMAVCTTDRADSSPRYTGMLLGCSATN